MKKLNFTLLADTKLVPVVLTTTPDGQLATPVSRQQLLKEYKAGDRTSVQFQATVFVEGPNKNHVILNPAEMETFAASFKGQPFLADHSRTQANRGGTIVASEMVSLDGGKRGIRQTIAAVKPWAVEGVLDDTVDRFSIGWSANEYFCTACEKDFLDCAHMPWDLGRPDKETGKTVEILMKGLEGAEVSAVTHPAVGGTSTDTIMEALCAAKSVDFEKGIQSFKQSVIASGISPESKETNMLEKLLSKLGLSANASEAEALSALEALKSQPRVPKSLCLAAGLPESASENELIGKIISIQAPGAFVAKADHDKVAEELHAIKVDHVVASALAEGKITPAGEAWARARAMESLAGFAAYLEGAPKQVPLGAKQPEITPAGKRKTLTLEQSIVARSRGLSEEDFLKVEEEVAQSDAKFAARYGN